MPGHEVVCTVAAGIPTEETLTRDLLQAPEVLSRDGLVALSVPFPQFSSKCARGFYTEARRAFVAAVVLPLFMTMKGVSICCIGACRVFRGAATRDGQPTGDRARDGSVPPRAGTRMPPLACPP